MNDKRKPPKKNESKNKAPQKGAGSAAHSTRRTPDKRIWLFALYLACTLLRLLLAQTVGMGPQIYQDETLYQNLAKSLLTEGTPLFYGQPIRYTSLLYPLLLSPLYALAQATGWNAYRLMLTLNAFMISASIFPAYALAKRIARAPGAIWAVAVMTAILPDLALSRLTFTENLSYPLTLCTLLFGYRALGEEKPLRPALAMAALGAALYFVKPGLIAVCASLCVVLCLSALRPFDRRRLIAGLCASALCAALIFSLSALFTTAFHVDTAQTEVYARQIKAFSWNNVVGALTAALPLSYFFFASFLVVPLVVTFCGARRFDGADRRFLLALMLCVAGTILGTAYAINLDETGGDLLRGRMHLRYVAIFTPPLLALCLSRRLEGLRLNVASGAMLALLVLANAIITPQASTSLTAQSIDMLSLAAFMTGAGKAVLSVVLYVVIVVSGLILWRVGWKPWVRRLTLCALSLMMLISGGFGYAYRNIETPETLETDLMSTAAIANAAEQAMVLVSDGEIGTMANMSLDAQLTRSTQTVTLSTLALNATSEGVYRPFLPPDGNRTKACFQTPDNPLLVLQAEALSALVLRSPYTPLVSVVGTFATMRLQNDTPWLSAALLGHTNNIFEGNGVLLVYDETLLHTGMLRITFTATANQNDAALMFRAGDESRLVTLDTSRRVFTVDFPLSTATRPARIDISCEASSYYIVRYKLEAVANGT